MLLFYLVFSCSTKKELQVDYSNATIEYSGRIDSSKVRGVDLYWSGTSIKFNFEGEAISALFEDEKGDNYYNIIIDNDSLYIFRPDTIKRYYELASELPKGQHSIEIFRRTEWDRGKTSFYGFKILGETKILPKSPPRKRKIEFYGNSITAGFAIEDFSGKDSADSTYTNNYLSYSALTARHFQANYHCICRSGIGITVSWIPLIMPEMYNRLNPTDPKSLWNFSLYTPDIVVINLFQNDRGLVGLRENENFKKRFGDEPPDDEFIINAYQQFVGSIRNQYPNAKIVCTLGAMDAAKEGSKWVEYIKVAVENLKDDSIYIHIMPYIESTAHPVVSEHEEMAESLIGFIEENIEW